MRIPGAGFLRGVVAASALAGVAGAREERVVELPPYVVNEQSPHAQLGVPPWRFVRAGSVEVVSQAADWATLRLLRHHHVLNHLLAELVPPALQVQLERPDIFVVYNLRVHLPVPGELLAALRRTQAAEEKDGRGGPVEWSIRDLLNYRFWDLDSTATFLVLDEDAIRRASVTLTPVDVRSRLERRVPALAPWFVEGFLEFYRGNVRMESHLPSRNSSLVAADPRTAEPVGEIEVEPLVWVSRAETERLKRDPELHGVELLPMGELFGEPPEWAAEPDREPMRRRQLVLFLRWALDPGLGVDRRPGLWRFVEATARGRAAPELFRECFGVGEYEAGQELLDYLPQAIRQGYRIDPGPPPPLAIPPLRDATPDEKSLLRGELERMEVAHVARVSPDLRRMYAGQARRQLQPAYDRGNRELRLIEALALCECDAGEAEAALPFLREAEARPGVKPRITYELARIGLAEARLRAPDGHVSRADAAGLLALLRTAHRQPPPMAEVDELFAEVWLRAGLAPAPEDFALLDEAVARYPRRASLALPVAILHGLHGDRERARKLATGALGFASDPALRARLQRLLGTLEAAAAEAGQQKGPGH